MKNKNDGFSYIYPFATENVFGYLDKFSLMGKDVLTVGSSLDQLLNAVVLGAKKVTVLDINPNVEKYYLDKLDILKKSTVKDFYSNVMSFCSQDYFFSKDVLSKEQIYRSNLYLHNNELFEYIKYNISKVEIDFVNGNIFDMGKIELSCLYDCMILSNILQYTNYYFKNKSDGFKWLRDCFEIWDSYLNDEGILQLLYLYSYDYNDVFCDNHPIFTYNLKYVYQALYGFKLDIEWIDGIFPNSKDAIVTYQKKLLKK